LILLACGFLLNAQNLSANGNESQSHSKTESQIGSATSPPQQPEEQTEHSQTAQKNSGTIQTVPPSALSPSNRNIGSNLPSLSQPEASKEPEQNSKWLDKLLDVTITDVINVIIAAVIACFTIQLTTATVQMAIISRQQVETTRTIERAYVQLSHMPPGVWFGQNGEVSVQMRVKNFGKTPARTQRVNVEFLYLPDNIIPLDPPLINSLNAVLSFMLPNDEFFFTEERGVLLGSEVVNRLMAGNGTLLVYGHVDYLDQFDRRHRAGYGRIYNHLHHADGNLDLVTNRAYNYDRPRQPDEPG